WVWIDKTRSKEYLILGTSSKTTSEIRFLKADNPPANAEFKLIHPRETDMEYDVYHHQDKFYIQTNEADSKNFKIMTAPVENPCKANWKEFIPHRDSVYISAFDVFKDYVVIHERKNGLEDMRIIDLNSMKEHYVGFPEPVYVFYSGRNPNFDTKTYRFTYESLVTPYSTFDYNMKTREKELKKQQVVLGGYEPSQYESERVFAQSKDSTMIPISLVYKKDLFKKDGSNPLLLNGYGSYGDCNDPYFSTSRLSLLDRGFVYAFAHIRGGGEMGKIWYEQGRVLSKMNTFTDFIACAEYLISEKYTSPEKLVIEGRSAGGLLIGAVLNIQPDLFRVAIVEVPFVDIVNTMLDTTLTAVVTDYEEWGNPNDKEQFEYMMSYCPYQNVKAQDYPDILILAGFYDPRVNFWEPAKWVAKLRALKTDDNKLLLKTNVSGHGIASGWYDFYKEIALEYAFIFDVLGIEK
ncbi:MAG: S9 family peptidase, partial [Candidatus Cloacimonetes bacterium]|nr:S9 family peptidase [Candidatus Cloacimonadota bacterium]